MRSAGIVAAAEVRPPLPVERFSEIQPSLNGLWLVKRLLPATGLALIYGHPNCGKSFFAIDLAIHVAMGWSYRGRRVRQGLVVYVGAEGGTGLRNRIAALRQAHNLTDRVPFALIPSPIDLQSPDADVGKLIQTIRTEAAFFGCDVSLIVVDTLSKTFGGGKENTDDMATYVANCGRVSSEFNACVVPVHHRPKDAESTEPRGHSSLKGGVDTVILVEAGQTKSAEVTKQRDAEIGDRFLFNLRVVELGQDEDGDPVTSCVVEPTDVDLTPTVDPFQRAVGKLSANNRLIYDQLGSLLEAAGTPVPASIGDDVIDRLRVGKVAALDDWRDKSISAAGTGAGHDRDTGKRAFNRALTALRKAGIVGVWEQYAWITFRIPGTEPGPVPGHDRDAGTTGTGVFRPCPNVPPRQSTMILAPGETGDEPIPGFEGLA